MKISMITQNLRAVPIGSVVESKTGHWFQLVSRVKDKESWKDLETNITWHDREKNWVPAYIAMKNYSNKLPTIEELDVAIKHGIAEILPNFLRPTGAYNPLWTASIVASPDGDDFSYYSYDERGPHIHFAHYNTRCWVRCVERP